MIIYTIKKYVYILFLVIVFWWWSVFGYDSMNIAPLDNFVVDHTQTLNSSQIESLSSGAYSIQQQTSAQITALIIPDRGDYELYDIALKVFRDSKLWTKDLNNGLLLIIAKDEKKIRLTVGYGLEWIIPDILARDIIEQIRPFVDNGDIYGALQTYYTIITPYLQDTGRIYQQENTLWYKLTIWDQIRWILLFIAMSSALWSKRLKNISLSSEKKKSLSKSILTIGTGRLIILAIISFALFSFGFVGWLLGYIFWLITGNGQWFTLSSGRGRWYYGWGGFWGFGSGGWRWSSWWGFSGWFGGSSWWGGAGD